MTGVQIYRAVERTAADWDDLTGTEQEPVTAMADLFDGRVPDPSRKRDRASLAGKPSHWWFFRLSRRGERWAEKGSRIVKRFEGGEAIVMVAGMDGGGRFRQFLFLPKDWTREKALAAIDELAVRAAKRREERP